MFFEATSSRSHFGRSDEGKHGLHAHHVHYRRCHRCSVIKGFYRNFTKCTGKHLCQSLFLIEMQACNFFKKETLAQVLSYEFCKISNNTLFIEPLWATASVTTIQYQKDNMPWCCLSQYFQYFAQYRLYFCVLILLYLL